MKCEETYNAMEIFMHLRKMAESCNRYSYNIGTRNIHRNVNGEIIYLDDLLDKIMEVEREVLNNLKKNKKR